MIGGVVGGKLYQSMCDTDCLTESKHLKLYQSMCDTDCLTESKHLSAF
jgi:hypothetical protein